MYSLVFGLLLALWIICIPQVFDISVQHIDYSSRTSVNKALNRLTKIIRSYADTLFS